MSDQNLQSQIAALESNTNASIPAAQVQELIISVKEMFGEHFQGRESNLNQQALYQELGELAKFINTAKKELQEVNDSNIAGKEIPDASTQLEEIVRMTEQSTSQIMDSCERIQSTHATMKDRLIAMDPPLDPDALAGVDDAIMEADASVTQIYEACNFQDITGQRIQKVVKALQEIERQVLRMVVVFGLSQKEELDDQKKQELQQDAELLSGPAMAGQGLDQDDIDDILQTLL